MTNRRELADRLEAAQCGSRELDWRIADAMNHPSFEKRFENFWPGFGEGSKLDLAIPAYTTSLDATLALAERVLPGWTWELTIDGCGTVQGAPEMWPEGLAAPDRGGVHSTAQTAPLALCAAILRARLDDEGKGG